MLTYRKSHYRGLATAAGAIALMLCFSVFVASSSASAVAKASKKAPITVLVTAPVNDPAVALPQWFDIAEIYAKQTNAAGGWDGHPVKIVTCDNQLSATVTVSCAREAGTDHAVAELGFALGSTAMMQVLQSEHVAWIPGDAATPIELESPISFPPTLTALYQASGEIALAIKDKCTSVALFVPSDLAAEGSVQAAELGANGIKSSAVSVPVTATDVSSYLAQTSSDQCLVLSGVSDNFIAQLGVDLPQLGHKFKDIISDPSLTTALASKAASTWKGTQIASVITNINTPTWAVFRAGIKKYATLSQTKYPYSEGQGNYAAITLLGNVVDSILAKGKTANAKSVLAALSSNTTWSVDGLVPPVNFTKKLGVPNSPRLASPYAGFSIVNASGQVIGGYGNKYVSILPLLLNKKVSGGFYS